MVTTVQEPIQSVLSSLSFLVVGVARNCGKSIGDDVGRISQALQPAQSVSWLIVESDSDDATAEELSKLALSIDRFQFISLGALRETTPQRTARIALCRNAYVDAMRENPRYANIDYVIVADFDGINSEISQSAIESCWQRNDWDVCAANQNAPYYDIYALRHPYWCPCDWMQQYDFLNAISGESEKNRYIALRSKQITIPIDHDWIEVDSAFGGFAIYKRDLFHMSSYSGLTHDGDEVCEHVRFHALLRKGKAKIFINPALINTKYTDHTNCLTRVNKLKSMLRRVIIFCVGRTNIRLMRAWIGSRKL